MRTLVLFGAARENGYTKKLLDSFLEEGEGEIKIIDAFRIKNIKPCIDCRYCFLKRQCSIKDSMQDVYAAIDEADCIVLATPMYFNSVTGPMKLIIDRLQMYWAGTRRKDREKEKLKKGVILMIGGAPAFENQFLGGELVLKGVLSDLSSECMGIVSVPNSDLITKEQFKYYINDTKAISRKIYGTI